MLNSRDLRPAATIVAFGLVGGMVFTGWASKPTVVYAFAPAPVAAAPAAAPAPVAAAPVAAAPVAAVPAPAAKAKRKVVVRKVVVRTVPAAVIYYRAAPACSCML